MFKHEEKAGSPASMLMRGSEGHDKSPHVSKLMQGGDAKVAPAARVPGNPGNHYGQSMSYSNKASSNPSNHYGEASARPRMTRRMAAS
jgi:hypothetical protein